MVLHNPERTNKTGILIRIYVWKSTLPTKSIKYVKIILRNIPDIYEKKIYKISLRMLEKGWKNWKPYCAPSWQEKLLRIFSKHHVCLYNLNHIPKWLFFKIDRIVPKFIKRSEWIRRSKKTLKKKNNEGELLWLILKVIKTARTVSRSLCKNWQTGKWNEISCPKTNFCNDVKQQK